MASTIPPPNRVADAIAAHLAIFMGPHTGRAAVRGAAMKALGRGPETLTRADVAALHDPLFRMLRTFLGGARARAVLGEIEKELGA